jgi:hypothetical protein
MRKQFNHIIIGGNGSGKTTFFIKIAIKYFELNPKKRILFLMPDDSEKKLEKIKEINFEQITKFSGISKMIVDNDKIFSKILDIFGSGTPFNGLIVCEDPGVYLGRRPENVLKLFKRRRQTNIDFLWSFHGFNTEMPRSFFTYVNSVFLFETSDNHEWTKKLLPIDKQDEFEEKYKKIQEISKTKKYQCLELIIRNTK